MSTIQSQSGKAIAIAYRKLRSNGKGTSTKDIKLEPRQSLVESKTDNSQRTVPKSTGRKAVIKSTTIADQSGKSKSRAYRAASSKGKSSQKAFKKSGANQTASRAKMMNPEASTREIAKQVRNERCTRGKTCASTPSVSKRRSKSQAVKADQSQTLSGQNVSGTASPQSADKLTGHQKGSCKIVSGTEYLGVEEFKNCSTQPKANASKVGITRTTNEQVVSGTTVGQAKTTTGDLVGQCASVTGTEYLPAEQAQEFCGSNTTTTKATGFSITATPSNSGRKEVTGTETRKTTSTSLDINKSPKKVIVSQTGKGNQTTGMQVGNPKAVTGSESGFCKSVTGMDYQGANEIQSICSTNNTTETATKVTVSGTTGGQQVTGDRSSGISGMTGSEQGNCQSVTGTPYLGTEQLQACSTEQQNAIDTRLNSDNVAQVSGDEVGPEGLTGAQQGACSLVTGAKYQPAQQTALFCNPANAAQPGEADYPNAIGSAQPAAVVSEDNPSKITGKGWEKGNKVTGTEGMWAAQRNTSLKGNTMQAPLSASRFRPEGMKAVPMSPITGSSGNTDTGAKVTLSGGARA